MSNWNDSEVISEILRECKTIAVVGLSSNKRRASNGVSAYMQEHGYRIIPVNPNETEVLGEKAFANLSEIDEKVDLVDVFRKSDEAGSAVDEAIKIGAKAVWLQENVIDVAAAERAKDAGLLVVMNKCLMVEHLRNDWKDK